MSIDKMYNSPVFQWGKKFIDKIDLQSCKNILDIGCRAGQLSEYLARHYKKSSFLAIDNVKEEINRAQQYNLPNLSFEIADALSFGSTEHFDAIVSFSCLHWVENKHKVLQNIYKALKPGKKAYLQFFASHGRPKNDRFLYRTASSSSWKAYFKGFTPDYNEVTIGEISALLQGTGFLINKIEFVTYENIFEHGDNLQKWLKTWASHKNHVPRHKQDHFLQETVQSYLKHHNYSNASSFPYYEYLLEVICEKPEIPLELFGKPPHQYKHIIFSSREIEVLKHFLLGKSAKEIASLISISSKTVEFHLGSIKEKLNCHRRSEIYQAAISYGFIHLIFNHNF